MRTPFFTGMCCATLRSKAIIGLAIQLSLLIACSQRAIANEGELAQVVCREKVVHFFGGAKPTFHFDISANNSLSGRFSWQLTTGSRKIAFREVAVEIERGKPTTIEVQTALPPVKDGVDLALELRASLFKDGDSMPAAEWKKTLWLFPENPFTDRREWLAARRIHLFDPNGATAAALDELEIPYKNVRNLTALAEMSPGLVIVGEGASWASQRNLAPLVLEMAAKGTPVLCLAPAQGSLPLPLTTADELSEPLQVSFRRRDIIQELDQRLDAEAWVAGQPLAARGLAVAMEHGALVGKFVEPEEGWPWLELKYSHPRARLIWCGWPIVRDWDRSPVPRYLYAKLLERLSNSQQQSSGP